jgi:hypothetical protein
LEEIDASSERIIIASTKRTKQSIEAFVKKAVVDISTHTQMQ